MERTLHAVQGSLCGPQTSEDGVTDTMITTLSSNSSQGKFWEERGHVTGTLKEGQHTQTSQAFLNGSTLVQHKLQREMLPTPGHTTGIVTVHTRYPLVQQQAHSQRHSFRQPGNDLNVRRLVTDTEGLVYTQIECYKQQTGTRRVHAPAGTKEVGSEGSQARATCCMDSTLQAQP